MDFRSFPPFPLVWLQTWHGNLFAEARLLPSVITWSPVDSHSARWRITPPPPDLHIFELMGFVFLFWHGHFSGRNVDDHCKCIDLFSLNRLQCCLQLGRGEGRRGGGKGVGEKPLKQCGIYFLETWFIKLINLHVRRLGMNNCVWEFICQHDSYFSALSSAPLSLRWLVLYALSFLSSLLGRYGNMYLGTTEDTALKGGTHSPFCVRRLLFLQWWGISVTSSVINKLITFF